MTTYRPLTLDEKRRTLETCQRLDHEFRTRRYPAVLEADDVGDAEAGEPELRDAEDFFFAEQCPSDSNFR